MDPEDEIMRCERIAVAPPGRQPSVGTARPGRQPTFPTARQRREWSRGDLINVGQPFEQRDDDVEIVERNDHVRIEIAWLGAVPEIQHLIADPRLDWCFATSAAGEHEHGEQPESGRPRHSPKQCSKNA